MFLAFRQRAFYVRESEVHEMPIFSPLVMILPIVMD